MDSSNKKSGAIFKGEPIHLGEQEAVYPSHSPFVASSVFQGRNRNCSVSPCHGSVGRLVSSGPL